MTGETSLEPGDGCSITVEFEAVTRGPSEASLIVISEAQGSSSLGISAEGRSPGLLTSTNNEVRFGGVVLGEQVETRVEIRNSGDEPLTLGSHTLEGTNFEEFSVLSSTCGEEQQLGAADSCNLSVGFRPQLVSNSVSATLQIQSPDSPTLRIELTGQGLSRLVAAMPSSQSIPGVAE